MAADFYKNQYFYNINVYFDIYYLFCSLYFPSTIIEIIIFDNQTMNLNWNNDMHILNKTDKYFFISLIMLIAAFALPMLLIVLLIEISFKFNFEIPIIPEILFVFGIINYSLIIPILLITQIITFIIKIFSKDKNIKDWIIILFNLITPLFFGYIYLALFLMVRNL